jgi:hypothetical protein
MLSWSAPVNILVCDLKKTQIIPSPAAIPLMRQALSRAASALYHLQNPGRISPALKIHGSAGIPAPPRPPSRPPPAAPLALVCARRASSAATTGGSDGADNSPMSADVPAARSVHVDGSTAVDMDQYNDRWHQV